VDQSGGCGRSRRSGRRGSGPTTVAAVWARPVVQLRLSGHTSATYLAREGWREASLSGCPIHGGLECGFSRHGWYERVTPPGTKVARFRCPKARVTFSLLPDFLASRLSGTLDEVERVVCATEAAPSVEAAADVLRRDIELPGAVRWVRRRLSPVRTALVAIATLLPGCLPVTEDLREVRAHLGTEHALMELRGVAERYLGGIRWPVGLKPPDPGGVPRGGPRQHEMGADPGRESGQSPPTAAIQPREVR
jgi:hypothetical protein